MQQQNMPKPKFSDGERVLCFHGPLIYEAKALKHSLTNNKQVKYLIHYLGWNKNWDEWVLEDRVLKYNEANVQRQKEVSKQHATTSAKNKKGASANIANVKGKKVDTISSSSKDSSSRDSTPSKELTKESSPQVPNASSTPVQSSTSSSRNRSTKVSTTRSSTPLPSESSAVTELPKKKRGRIDPAVETEEQSQSKVEIKVKIPDDLKPWLVDDWDAINREHKLMIIPAKTSVQEIINGYISHKKSSKTTNQTKEVALTDVSFSLIEYFDVTLSSQLLYKFERVQYEELLQQHPDTPMSKLYGAFHLLRLFVKLGSWLAFTAVDEKSMQLLLGHLQDFLKYLVKNSSALFNMDQYINSTAEYQQKAI